MRKVMWTDAEGTDHAALVRNQDSDDIAKQGHGISADPPDVGKLDCAALLCDLHNELLRRGLITHDDVVASQNGVTAAILAVFRSSVLRLYRGG